MPLPLAYDACRVAEPIPSASCGAPVTSTDLLNVTVATIVSPRSYVELDNGAFSDNPVTAGGPCAPSTLWALDGTTTWLPSPSLAFADAVLWIVPEFSVRALAPTLIPSGSLSVATTM